MRAMKVKTMNTILIIEDQADIRRLIRWTLEPDDYEIHEASNGVRGLKEAQLLRPDLIVLDVMMPGELDGLEVCRRVKADPDLAHVPVVLLTALSREKDRQSGIQAGADVLLGKPFIPLELVEIVERLLRDRPAAPSAGDA